MRKLILSASATFALCTLFFSCASTKNIAQKKKTTLAVTSPPCNFYAGRLNISWLYVYDQKGLHLPYMQGADSLPKHFIAFKINTQALNSYLSSIDGIPFQERVINLPVNGGDGCMLFHLEPSGTMSEKLQKKFPDLKSFKGTSDDDPTASLRLDFDGKTLKAAVSHGDQVELISPWKGSNGELYYLLYYKKDSGYKHIPIKTNY